MASKPEILACLNAAALCIAAL